MNAKLFNVCRVWSMLVMILLLMPIATLIPLSFNAKPYFYYDASFFSDFPWNLSLRWYRMVFGSPAWREALNNSLFIASISSGLATILGTCAAIGLYQIQHSQLKSWLSRMFLAPLVAPLVMVSVSMFLYFNWVEQSWVLTYVSMLTDRYERLTIILAHTCITSPLVFILVSTSLNQFNWQMVKAARSLGGSYWRVFIGIIIKSIMPGIWAGFVMAFFGSLDELILVRLLGSAEDKTISTEMFSGLRDDLNPGILVVATCLLMVSSLGLLLATYLRKTRN